MARPRIGIVGCGGVGKAHAIAAINEGCDIEWVVDSSTAALDLYSRPKISNSWGAFTESAVFHPGSSRVMIQHDFRSIDLTRLRILQARPPVDLIIIALPNSLHAAAVTALAHVFPTTKILLEKPGHGASHPFNPDLLTINYEYVCHTMTECVLPLVRDYIQSASFYHNGEVPKDRGEEVHPRDDLLPHVLSVLTHLYGKGFKLECVEDTSARTRRPRMWSGEIQVWDNKGRFVKGITVGVGYLPPALYAHQASHAFTFKLECRTPHYPHDEVSLDWEMNLFQKAQRAVLNSNVAITA